MSPKYFWYSTRTKSNYTKLDGSPSLLSDAKSDRDL